MKTTLNPPPTEAQRLAERQRPSGPVVLKQRWEHLLFLHWKWDIATVQATLPAGLTVDTQQDAAWLGIVPLFMRDVRPSFVPPIPFVSDFLELNLRTYVYDSRGRPGVYFYSLDCDQSLVVETARRLLNLRYEHCQMRGTAGLDGAVEMEAQRVGTAIRSRYRYRPLTEPELAKPESLEFFLLERYRLFAADEKTGALSTIRISHEPYRFHEPLVIEWGDGPLQLAGFPVASRSPDHMCTTETQQVDTYAPEKVDR